MEFDERRGMEYVPWIMGVRVACMHQADSPSQTSRSVELVHEPAPLLFQESPTRTPRLFNPPLCFRNLHLS
jgi:hypothetical protein